MNKDIFKIVKDEKGRVLRKPCSSFIHLNAYSGYVEYVYDDNDNIIEEKKYKCNGELDSYIQHEFKDDLCVKTLHSYENDYITEYFYDDQKRVIKTVETKQSCEHSANLESLLKEFDFLNEEQGEFTDIAFLSDISESEYDENGNCIKTIAKTAYDEVLGIIENEYSNNKLVKVTTINYLGKVISITAYEYISDNEVKIITTQTSTNEKEVCINTCDDNDKLIKQVEYFDDGVVKNTYYDNNEIEKEIVFKNQDGEVLVDITRNYDENCNLSSVEIKGSNELVLNEKSVKLLQKPVVVEYKHFKTAMLLSCFALPILVLIAIGGCCVAKVLAEDSFGFSLFVYALSLFIFGISFWALYRIFKQKEKYLSYKLNTANSTITFDNVIVSEESLCVRTQLDNDKLLLPVVLHLNAITSAKFVKGDKYHADKLVLKIGDLTEFSFVTNAKILNILDKFIPIKYTGLCPKLFIKSVGADTQFG